MNPNCQNFIADVTSQVPSLNEAYENCVNYWKPDEPPITIAYAAVGRKIADEFDSLGSEARVAIMASIEQAMASDDEELATAVATGLIEAMAARSNQVEGQLPQILSYLGPLSRAHFDAWMS